MLNLLQACWDIHEEYLVVFVVVQNVVEIDSASFYDLQVLIFCEFGLRKPIHAPKMEVWEI